VVLEAVRQNGLALRYASEELRADQEVVLEAVRQHGLALGYAAEELQADRGFVLEALKWNATVFNTLPANLSGDPELRAAADRSALIRRATIERHRTAITPLALPPHTPDDRFTRISTYTLHCIRRVDVAQRLSKEVEDGINAVARLSWPDFHLCMELEVDDSNSRLYDFLFYLRDETNAIVGFRSAVWDRYAWVFENGVVRDQGNGLGSIMLQQILNFFLTSELVADERRFVFANVEETNEANWRLYSNFRCRTPSHTGRGFVECAPSPKIKGAERAGFSGFAFPTVPAGHVSGRGLRRPRDGQAAGRQSTKRRRRV